ncbi:phage late control D family protein [Rhizobium leguminosarum]|uniref:phage late control D family protein n=1 Tax=Rhizobium leguminosarum TaxID=384 RepID=UPI001C94FC30|nr:late control protein [Rhizobium leguminosarum]MBY5562177.1 late control protein [Rhizobium leguminosarum]
MQAIYSVVVNGQDISNALHPILISLAVSDRAGSASDSADIEIDDTFGQIVMPKPRDLIEIKLGWKDQGFATVFIGKVDEVGARGSRSGRTLSIGAKGMDTRGKAKQKQRRHYDDSTISDALKAAGQTAGLSVVVDKAFASIRRPYIALDDESFVAFGERMARELGGTFKIVGNTAVLAKRNGGQNPAGQDLPAVVAQWGVNLHSYDIHPILGRPVEKEASARWYDSGAAEWKSETAETGTDDAETTRSSVYSEPDQDSAGERSQSDAAESDRRSGDGSVTIEGNIAAQPEGTCVVVGCRAGIDGTYRIEGVDHSYSRSGFITTLELRQPKDGAGRDTR